MKFFTADTHFNHSNIIEFCNRPFQSAEEMNEVLITNWNSKVGENDQVYHLGDFGGGELRTVFDRLNGKIYYIPSQEWTHERAVQDYKDRFAQIAPLMTISIKKEYDVYLTLCHYQMAKWPKSHYNHWHLFGHSHGRATAIGKSIDVGVDNNNYFPYSLKEIAKIMDERPDNPNYTKQRGFYRQKLEEEE